MKIKYLSFFIILFSLTGLLAWELFYPQSRELPSALIGEDIPVFNLPNIFPDKPALRSESLKGNVLLLNIFASWCESCTAEHDMLLKIKNEYHIPVFGIAYKDKPENIIAWLKHSGNPYVLIGNDDSGDAAIDLGVYGTPETFVIRDGKIIYRHVGVLDQKAWDEKLFPLIKDNWIASA